VNLLARQIFASGAEKSGWKPMAQTLFRLAWEKTAAAYLVLLLLQNPR
jgi:hypothetical protein